MNKEKMRLAHNFLLKERNNEYSPSDLDLLNGFLDFSKTTNISKSHKVALTLVSVNPNYWQYTSQVVEDIQKFFLPGHKTDIFIWSDMPRWTPEEILKKIKIAKDTEQKALKDDLNQEEKIQAFFDVVTCYLEALYLGHPADESQVILGLRRIGLDSEFQQTQDGTRRNLLIKNINENTPTLIANAAIDLLQKQKNLVETCTVFEMEPIEWPFGTLMRYSMFLQQEEKLKEYDYLFYMDVDMRVVNVVGDEILGEGLTMAEHPMYSLRHEYVPPYEPNKDSKAYIPRFAQVINESGKPRLKPLYAAGGFQGGTSKEFISAMRTMKSNIDKDFNNNYIAIWNDESHWNKYLFDYQGPITALSPSYVYPDSLINEYYIKVWGRNYPPKIITLTKSFTLQKMDANRFSNM